MKKRIFVRCLCGHIGRHIEIFLNTIQKPYIRFLFWLKAVNVGAGCKFYGIPYVHVYKSGKIQIGKRCTFRSRECSNHMGLNHRCILSVTYTEKGKDAKLIIGDQCGFSGVTIWCFKEIIIGNNVRVGANTIIMDGDAHDDDPRTTPPDAIRIEDNVFIGANCIIKKGVIIGANSVIGMNSVVTKNIPANVIAVGIPAKVIREINAI